VPARSLRTPSYRLHKPSGQAVVTLGGRDIYLGRHDTPESAAEYDRVIAEWLAHGRRLHAPNPGSASGLSDLTVNEVMLAYLRHADAYYVKNGRPTKEPVNIRLALRPLRKLYGHTAARDFGPLALKAVRRMMIDSDLCRTEVNKRVRHVVRAFKWAVGEEMVPSSVHHGLKAVAGLRQGRADVRESEPVKPAPEADVDAIRPHVARQVWAMVELQRLTGMRPGEVVLMRTRDIDTRDRVWVYTPSEHKTEHHGKVRRVCLGPKARAVVRPWLRADLGAFLFSPSEAMEEYRAALRRNRKTPMTPSQAARTRKGKPKKAPGDRYSTDTYRRAVTYGCKRAGVAKWYPHQLRHNAATRLRKEFGLDAARAVLGHSSPTVTEIYAELDAAKAAEAMELVG
jgi:integrase